MAVYEVLETGTRICDVCNKELPITDFGINKTCPGGRSATCKKCKAEYAKQYNKEHKEQVKLYKQQYYINNKASLTEKNKKYREENKEKLSNIAKNKYASDEFYKAKKLIYQKVYNEQLTEESKAQRKQYLQEWYLNNEEHIKDYVKNNKDKINARRRERYHSETNRQKRELGIEMSRKSTTGWTKEEYAKALFDQKGCCYLCGIHIENASKGVLVADHDHATGIKRRLLCHTCNRGLGLFHDNPELLEKAASYIREFKPKENLNESENKSNPT